MQIIFSGGIKLFANLLVNAVRMQMILAGGTKLFIDIIVNTEQTEN